MALSKTSISQILVKLLFLQCLYQILFCNLGKSQDSQYFKSNSLAEWCVACTLPQGEGGRVPHETAKSVVEKWCYFREQYKMAKVLEYGIENGEKINFPMRFSYAYFKNFSKISNFKRVLAKKRKNFSVYYFNTKQHWTIRRHYVLW